MNRFMEQLRAIVTQPGTARTIRQGVTTFEAVGADAHPITMQKGEYYRISVKLGADVFMADAALGSRHRLATKLLQDQILEDVYGQTRAMVREAAVMLAELRTPDNYLELEPVMDKLRDALETMAHR